MSDSKYEHLFQFYNLKISSFIESSESIFGIFMGIELFQFSFLYATQTYNRSYLATHVITMRDITNQPLSTPFSLIGFEIEILIFFIFLQLGMAVYIGRLF